MIRTTIEAERTALIQDGLGDHYRMLAERLRRMTRNSGEPLRVIGITSSTPREGVTTVAANLTSALATEEQKRIALVDANFTRPGLSTALGLTERNGLADVLVGACDLEDVIHTSDDSIVSVIPAGTSIARERCGFDTANWEPVLEQLPRHFDLAVLDLPAATTTSLCLPLTALIDGVILVLEAERARTRVAYRIKKSFLEMDAELLGVVFNKRPNHIPNWLYRRL